MTQPPGPQGPFPQYPHGQPPGGGFPQQPDAWQAQPPGWSGGWQQPDQWQAQPPGDWQGQQTDAWQGQQPGGWQGQQPGFGQPGQPAGQDPFSDDEDGRKSKWPRILGGVGALVVIGGVVLLIVLLGTGPSKGATAQETADAFASAFNDRDVDGVKALLCEANLKGEIGKALDNGDVFADQPENLTIEVAKVEQAGSDSATAHYRQVDDGKPTEGTIPVPLKKNGDVWEICVQQPVTTGEPAG